MKLKSFSYFKIAEVNIADLNVLLYNKDKKNHLLIIRYKIEPNPTQIVLISD